MNDTSCYIELHSDMFTPRKKKFFSSDAFSLSLERNRYSVEKVTVSIGRGEFEWLPFLGQQIWDWKIDGKSMKFEGFLSEPSYGRNFLENYGAFLVHCGMSAMGNPSVHDRHTHHGELPVLPFDRAYISYDPNNSTHPLCLGGVVVYQVPFITHYEVTTEVCLSFDGLHAKVSVTLHNPTNTDLPYMYLGHINYGYSGLQSLSYTEGPFNIDNVEVLRDGGSGILSDPSSMFSYSEDDIFDPELVAVIALDTEKRWHTHRAWYCDGSSRYVKIDSSTLDYTVAWITHTANRGACGFSLPSTAGPRGFTAEKELNNIKYVEPKQNVCLSYEFGYTEGT